MCRQTRGIPIGHSICDGCLLYTDTGRVYTWGDGRYGQLGNLARKHNMLATPHLVDRLISMDVHAVQISCGQYHTACISGTSDIRVPATGSIA